MADAYRIGEAAELIGVRVETLRRWEREGKLETSRTSGGQRLVAASEVARLLAQRERPRVTAGSVRNRFSAVVTEIKRDKLAATVELLSGPNRILAFVTREAVDEMQLEPGMRAVATVKATNVMLELDE